MKFTKENFAETLQKELAKKVEKPSISDKTFQAQVETLFAFAGEDDELDAFVQKVLPAMVSLDGNYRKDNADFVKKWESEHPTEKPKETPPATPPTNDEALAEIRKELQALKAERDAENSRRTVAQKRDELLAKLKENNISSKWAEAYAKKLPISGETDIEGEVKDALALFNDTESNFGPAVTPQRTGSPQAKEDNSDVLAALKQRRGEV